MSCVDEADQFVRATEALRPADAVAALLLLDDGRYVMQLRDANPQIFYPSHWGCFGGAVDTGENALDALRRELDEEIEFRMQEAYWFTRFEFDFSSLGHPPVWRIYYEVRVKDDEFHRFVLHEGAEMRAFPGEELLAHERVAPYDAFALWMHMSRRRFGKTGN
jgi:8-oxo-dGTP pyrophosphatase MutT (NUDIX family)